MGGVEVLARSHVGHMHRLYAGGEVLTQLTEIKNPISLARLLLDHTTQTLSLRRVPPNLLVGQGATNFAYEHAMPVLPLDYLVSPAAKDRWRKWKGDLIKAERNKRREEADRYGLSPPPSADWDLSSAIQDQYDQENDRRKHTQGMMAGMWNEAQPISPPPSDSRQEADEYTLPSSRHASSLSMRDMELPTAAENDIEDESFDPFGPPGIELASKNPFANSTDKMMPMAFTHEYRHRSRADGSGSLMMGRHCGSDLDLSGMGNLDSRPLTHEGQNSHVAVWDGSSGSESDSTAIEFKGRSPRQVPQAQDEAMEDTILNPLPITPDEKKLESPTPFAGTPLGHVHSRPPLPPSQLPQRDGAHPDHDHVTDTVGAIAIDMYGNISCGASSGGIGMKHRGRIGPAALVGIGAAVIPIDPEDPDRQCVATVTSGTGEHMGTTQAASVCSERLYHNKRKVAGGKYEEVGDDEAIHGFIKKDFMGHPSVKNSHSSGAIGMLSVKKTKDGCYLYFGHNTDSFALASMHADETKPVCTMSRSKGGGVIAQGGRAIRYRRGKKL